MSIHSKKKKKKKKKGKNLSPQQSKTKRRKQNLKNQRKKKKKKKKKGKWARGDWARVRDGERQRGSAATPWSRDAVSPWRREARDGETRETESETTRPTPRRRLRERDPRRFPICPAHRYLLFNSYLFLQISKPCESVIWDSENQRNCACVLEVTELIWCLCCAAEPLKSELNLFVFFFLFWVFGFVSLWLCGSCCLALYR